MVKKFKFDWAATKEKIKQEETSKAKSFGDDRFWKLEVHKELKTGSAIIRFLPDTEGTPFKKYFAHWFTYGTKEGKKRWYTKKCATTIGGECPICDKNKELFESPHESDKDIARERKRKIHYVANIEVIKDPAHEENNGKVRLFDFGPQVHGFYKLALFGKEMTDAEKAEAEKLGVTLAQENLFVPCDFEEGANFFYRSTLDDGKSSGKRKWNTYSTSLFQPLSNIRPDLSGNEWDEAIAELMGQTHLLSEFDDPQSFPQESSVRAELGHILGLGANTSMGTDISKEKVQNLNNGSDDNESEDPEMESITVDSNEQTDEDFIAALESGE